MKGFLQALLLLSLPALVACQGGMQATTMSDPLTATVLYQGRQCGQAPEAALTWLDDATALEKVARRLGRSNALVDNVDFSRETVLLIEMGTQPTAGYALALADENIVLVQTIAKLTLDWRRPPPDAMVAQVLTSPCLLLSLPRSGYDRIEVMDSQGERRLVLDLDS